MAEGGSQPINEALFPVAQPQINRVSVKIPPFWKANPRLWFRQLESQFFNAGVTSDVTKYHTLVGAIESDILAQVSDIILDPPERNLYETLKRRLEERFSESEDQQLRKLIGELELGDKRPSQLLREMRELSANRVSDVLLKSLWLQRLSTQTQAILSVGDQDLTSLAAMADKIAEVTTPSALHVVSSPRIPSSPAGQSTPNALDDIVTEMRRLSARIDALDRGRSKTSTRDPDSGSQRRSRSRSRRHVNSVCYYHNKFKDKATMCLLPCRYVASSSTTAENETGRR